MSQAQELCTFRRMKLFSPTVRRALIAAVVIGAAAMIVMAIMPPDVVRTPLEGAQLAGTRGIRLEGEQPVPRFDDQRAPIVVAPPAQGQWSAYAARDGDRVQLTTVVEPVDDVQRIRVQAPLPIGRWDLVLEDDARHTRWPVRFAKVPTPSTVITRLKAEAEALAVADRPAFWVTAAQGDGALADRQVAAVELGRAHIAAGDMAKATLAYQDAARLAGEMGEIGEQAGRLRAAAWTLYRQRRFEEALSMLSDAGVVLTTMRDATATARSDYLRGCIERETGLFRSATSSLRRAVANASSTADESLRATCVNELATLLSDLGQHRTALDLLEETPTVGPAKGRRLTTRGWIASRLAQTAPEYLALARKSLEEAMTYLKNPDVRFSALINLIELDLSEARLENVRRNLKQIDKDGAVFGQREVTLIRGTLALRTRSFVVASALFDEVLTEPLATHEERWRAALGAAQVAHAQGDLAKAIKLANHAATALKQSSRQSAVSGARATWLADRKQLIETTVRLHLDRGHSLQALSALDGLRAWVFEDLDARLRVERLPKAERSAWFSAQAAYRRSRATLDAHQAECRHAPSDERPACAKQLTSLKSAVNAAFDEMYLVLDRSAPSAISNTRLPTLPANRALVTAFGFDGRVVAFWLQGPNVTVAETTAEDPLAPFVKRITEVEHLYVVGAAGVDLRKSARDTLADKSTTWSEVPFAGLLAQPQVDALGAPVVIADPTADLQHARAEGRAVHTRLGGSMLLGEQATQAATLDAISSGARVLHFAGHGALDAESPWQAHLLLANDERLTLADLLVARPILGIVFLSGCETGVRGALSSQHAVGLPDAFLLSGARAVIATDRVVPDADARTFVDHFYKHPDWASRPAAAFHSAVRALRAAGNPIWTAFRLMGRA